jgi:hypothetical protein
MEPSIAIGPWATMSQIAIIVLYCSSYFSLSRNWSPRCRILFTSGFILLLIALTTERVVLHKQCERCGSLTAIDELCVLGVPLHEFGRREFYSDEDLIADALGVACTHLNMKTSISDRLFLGILRYPGFPVATLIPSQYFAILKTTPTSSTLTRVKTLAASTPMLRKSFDRQVFANHNYLWYAHFLEVIKNPPGASDKSEVDILLQTEH